MNFWSRKDKHGRCNEKDAKRTMKIPQFEKKETTEKKETIVSTGKQGETIDLVSGTVYPEGEIKDKAIAKKDSGSKFFKSQKPPTPFVSPINIIKSKLLVICIELTYPHDKICNIIKRYIEKERAKFVKIILFKNGIYQTEIDFSNTLTDEKIENFVKEKKELDGYIRETIQRDNILLFDAIAETAAISEINFEKRKIKNYEYHIQEVKYIFVFSGDEKGSKISKEEVQLELMKVRLKNPNLHLMLSKYEKLVDICSLGFRTILKVSI